MYTSWILCQRYGICAPSLENAACTCTPPFVPKTARPRDLDWQREVGLRLQRTREALRVSQADAARLCGTKRAAWNNYEYGRRILDVEIATKFCNKFNVSLDWLYRGDMASLTVRMAERINDQVPVLATTEGDSD